MSEFDKVFAGQRLERWPGDTWNALIAGEVRDRAKPRPPDVRTGSQHSPVFAKLRWDGTAPIGPGAVVKLTDALFAPAADEIGGSHGLTFKASPFAAGDVVGHLHAITLGPIDGATDSGQSVGYGVVPEAWWALVEVTDAAHTHVDVPLDGGTKLSSGFCGLRILWKPAATGDQWVVIEAASSSDRHERYAYCSAEAGTPTYQARDTGFDVEPGDLGTALLYQWGNEPDENIDAGGWLVLRDPPSAGAVEFASVKGTVASGQVIRLVSNVEIMPGMVHGVDGVEIWGERVNPEDGVDGADGEDGPQGETGPQGPPGTPGPTYGEGYCVEIAGTTIHHDAITNAAGTQAVGVDADEFQFWWHDVDANDRTDAQWNTVTDYDDAEDQEWWHRDGAFEFQTIAGYDDAQACQFRIHLGGQWQFKTAADYDADEQQVLLNDNGTWKWYALTELEVVTDVGCEDGEIVVTKETILALVVEA